MQSDMVQCLIQAVNDAHSEYEIMKFMAEVILLKGDSILAKITDGSRISAELHMRFTEQSCYPGKEFRGDGPVHKKALEGIAHARPLDFGIEHDLQGAFHISTFIDKRMADADIVLQHGHGGLLCDSPHKIFAAARYEDVDILIKLAKGCHGFMGRDVYILDGIMRKTGTVEGFTQDGRKGEVGMQGLGTSAQNDSIP